MMRAKPWRRRKQRALGPYDLLTFSGLPEVLNCAGWYEPSAFDEAIELANEALRRDPNGDYSWVHGNLGWSYFYKGQYDAAIEHTLLVPEPWVWNYVVIALSYGAMGKKEEAKAALDKAIALEPSFSAAYYRKWTCYPNSSAAEREITELKKVGLPEL